MTCCRHTKHDQNKVNSQNDLNLWSQFTMLNQWAFSDISGGGLNRF